ncbi:MAG: rhodanese-like domain-containing protein [Porticoccaceae bacterium]|nr:rhodanese-like domain-containing protein [Porticoccaceae bacterium]
MAADIPRLLEPALLQSILDSTAGDNNLIIVDLCSDALYCQKHVPSAVHLQPGVLMAGTAPYPGKLPTIEQLTNIIQYLGIDAGSHVVIYDDEGGGWAGRFAWTLDLLGYQNWSYLNGGIVAWIREGFATESQANQATASNTSVSIANPTVWVSTDDIISQLGNSDFAVWDARSPGEYSGNMVRSARGGHIPGAINIEWTELMDRQRNLRIREDAQALLSSAGLGRDKAIATHCQSHHRSGFTYMVARILDYKHISAYDGSWAEWGSLDHTPIERGD